MRIADNFEAIAVRLADLRGHSTTLTFDRDIPVTTIYKAEFASPEEIQRAFEACGLVCGNKNFDFSEAADRFVKAGVLSRNEARAEIDKGGVRCLKT